MNTQNTQTTPATPQKTPLYLEHQSLDAKIVDFGGWALPVNYGSQIEEHHAVRRNCGLFDVSHMTVSDITGNDTLSYLSLLLANDINKVTSMTGKALYSCMLNEQGGVIDDLIVYYLNDQHCRVVSNAGTNHKVIAWMSQQSQQFDVIVTERPELALIAVQGPQAIKQCTSLLDDRFSSVINDLKRFQGAFINNDTQQSFVGRTGYTGEDGLEFIINQELAVELWQTFISAGIQACGLGARDTLRLEAGMSLYGNDLDEQHTPIESGLAWTVSNKDDREFIGKAALASPGYKMIGLILLDRGVLRGHQTVHLNGTQIGEITSGTFSPTLEKSIAIARINQDANVELGQQLQIAIRNKFVNVQVARYPFVKNSQSTN